MTKEPAITVGAISAVVAAVLVFLQAFGVPINDSQQEAIRGLVAVIAPFIVGLIARQYVWSPQSVQDATQAAAASGTAPKIV